jgi:putative NADPH-quinone reductase
VCEIPGQRAWEEGIDISGRDSERSRFLSGISMVYRILVLFAHPALHKSRINRQLIAAIRNLENVTINDLYEEYPDFYINVKREQQLLIDHDIIIFQHPFYWYSSPAILKQWEDLVLEFGFAYGPGGIKLQQKLALSAITAGGPLSAYRRDGYNYFTIRELLTPFEQTARFCGILGLVGHGGGDVMHVAEFGVVMMLFLVGLELRPNLLWRLRGPILGTGGLQVILTTLAITVLAPLKTRFLCHHANRPGRQDCNEEWQHITRHRIIADAVNRIGHQSDAKDAETDQRELS